jgi:hypothetical protein
MFEHRSAASGAPQFLMRSRRVHLHEDGGTKAPSLCELHVIDRIVVSLKWYGATATVGSSGYSKVRKLYLDWTYPAIAFHSPQFVEFQTKQGHCSAGGNPGATSGP